MADLDTRSKRASSVNILKPYKLALVLPDGTINQADRQHSAWAYSGIPASGGDVTLCTKIVIPFIPDLISSGLIQIKGG